ncbi:MAG: anti-sigma factor [Pyrinomonadaceae bacterium]
MSGKVCRETRREIDQSELGQSLSAQAEGHVAECRECAAFRDERLRLRELVGALQPVAAPADFDLRLRARMARERDSRKQPFIFRFVMSTPAITVAALFVMLAGTTVFISQRNTKVNPSVAAGGEEKPAVATNANLPAAPANTDNPTPIQNPAVPGVSESPRRLNVAQSTTKTETANTTESQVKDLATMRAESFRLVPDRAGEVSVIAPLKPMVVTMYDEHGGTRKIQLPPISFGSQRLTDNRMPVSMTNTRDW